MGLFGDDPLAAAQEELLRRRDAADGTRDYHLLAELHDVADHVRRVALPTATTHYRAEKAGVLLAVALRTNYAALRDYADWPSPESDDDLAMRDATRVLTELVGPVRMVMWHAARGEPIQRSDAARVTDAAQQVSAWAAEIEAAAVPDEPVEET